MAFLALAFTLVSGPGQLLALAPLFHSSALPQIKTVLPQIKTALPQIKDALPQKETEVLQVRSAPRLTDNLDNFYIAFV